MNVLLTTTAKLGAACSPRGQQLRHPITAFVTLPAASAYYLGQNPTSESRRRT